MDSRKRTLRLKAGLLAGLLSLGTIANANPVLAPGNTVLRDDLQLLNDSGVIDIPLTAWPVSINDVALATAGALPDKLSPSVQAALFRIREQQHYAMAIDDPVFNFDISAAYNPIFIRSFEDTPREEGELQLSYAWLGERFAVNLAASIVANPWDGDEFRPDGTFLGMALGNWMLTAGWQDRWWGPGRNSSLILSTNARPAPGVAIQRSASHPFKTKWLRWVGPWTLTSFISRLDDERYVNDALLFGIRGSFRPPGTGLEIGISRTAQLCGDGRPCSLSTFIDMFLGNDNKGVNVDPPDEPGNQLGGLDIRWRLPRQVPIALYMQWIGEDGRGGGEGIGAWLRMAGMEFWGQLGSTSHRTFFEVADTSCHEGGFGFSDAVPNCAYEHSIYQTGYRYKGKAIGYSTDGDSLSYSLGSTLVQSGGHSWNILLRYMELNRIGDTNTRNTVSPSSSTVADLHLSYHRQTSLGVFQIGVGLADVDGPVAEEVDNDASAYIQWSSR